MLFGGRYRELATLWDNKHLSYHNTFNEHVMCSPRACAQAEADSAGALEQEKDALKQQIADLRDKLSKAQSDLEYTKIAMENMVPRCVGWLVSLRIYEDT
jgi:hypothetical protein